MLAVTDSSTLILMAKTALLDHAIRYFGGITIPKAVETEVVEKGAQKGFVDAFLISQRIIEKKIRVVKIEQKKSLALRNNFGLHQGEAEAIALYTQISADVLGIDDGKAIKICRIMGVKFFTCLSLLIYFTEIKAISSEEATLKARELGIVGRYTREEVQKAMEKIEGVVK